MELVKIRINDFDGAPVAEHNMPCAVCRREHAVFQLHTGVFIPCWQCQEKGYELVKSKRWQLKLLKVLGLRGGA